MPARLIVGIGNPGPEYEGTRHNVGFEVVDQVAARMGLGFRDVAYAGWVAEGSRGGAPFALLKPLTYVNRTGAALRTLGRLMELAPSSILVVLDDLALDVGRLRFRSEGSSGGHNGMQSVLDELRTEGVPRLRVGIGSAPPAAWREHVLSPFDPEEREVVNRAVARAADAVESFLDGTDFERIAAATNRVSPGAPNQGPQPSEARVGVGVPGTEEASDRGASRGAPSGRETRADAIEKTRSSVAKYEGMFLIDNSRVKPDPESCVGVVNDLLGRHKATVVRTDRWDERKLAYEIKKQKRATYVLSHFEMEPGKVQDLRRDLDLNEDVLRSLVERIETEFPKFLTGAEYEALRPKREEDDRMDDRRDREDGDRRRGQRDEDIPEDLA
jgi:PTH1 family peptidyl-tRNA hydrolase